MGPEGRGLRRRAAGSSSVRLPLGLLGESAPHRLPPAATGHGLMARLNNEGPRESPGAAVRRPGGRRRSAQGDRVRRLRGVTAKSGAPGRITRDDDLPSPISCRF